MIPKSTIDDIMAAARIEEVVGDFVSLKKRGANLIGLCPFHGEKTPSFYVSPAKGIYKCFGCGKAGNPVSFIMEHEKASYVDALKYIAKKYNIEVVEERNQSDESIAAANEKESLLIALEYAAQHFQKNLLEDEEGKAVGKTYFYERGFRDDTIKKFGLGYAKKEWGNFTDHALKAGYNLEYLQKAGLTKVNEQGRAFDMFRERVIFPFHNVSGRIVAFGGRQLVKDDKSPKYLNSPETEVYKKSEILYGIFFAKNSIRQHDRCYLVEGYTDVITLSQNGIENVAASSGTSLTEGQVKQISRFTKNVTIIYDGDAAGIKAALRGIDIVLAGGLNVKIVLLPQGEDPDSYCKALGGAAFEQYVKDNEKDFILYKSKMLLDEAQHDPVKKAEAVKDIANSIAQIPDPLTRQLFAQECSEQFGLDLGIILKEVNKSRRKTDVPDDEDRRLLDEIEAINNDHFQETEAPVILGDSQERGVIRVMMQFADMPYRETGVSVAQYIIDQLDADGFVIQNPLYAKVVEEVRHALAKENTERLEIEEKLPVDENFFIHNPDQEIVALAADLLSEKYKISPHWEEKFEIFITSEKENYQNDVDSVLLHLKMKKVDMLMDENQTALKTADSEEKENELLNMHVFYHQYRKRITDILGTIVVK